MNKIAKYICTENLKKEGSPIIIVTLVEEAEAVLNACKDLGINVSAFCDSESRKTKEKFCGLDVVHTPVLKKYYSDARFIIANPNIKDCARQLDELGFNEIYSSLEILEKYDVSKHIHRWPQPYMAQKIEVAKATHRSYFDEKQIFLRSIDVMITTKCSMNCANCCNLMQYYVDAKNTDEKIIEAVETLSANVDYIGEFRIIGGEPLVNKDWWKIINNIIAKDSNRKVLIYTNGTICPKDEHLESFKGKNVNFYITDYGKLSKNVDKMEETLKRHGIGYMRKPADNWVDCSNVRQHKRSVSRLKQVFKECCATTYYTLLNGRLYTCPFIANAANLNAIPDNKADYVDLFIEKKENLKNRISRLINMDAFFPACDFCDGRPNDPTTAKEYAGEGFIKAAKQTSEKISYTEYK